MNGEVSVVVRFRGIETDEDLRDILEKRCEALAQEFPETLGFELNLSLDAAQVEASAHVVGKNTDNAAHASAPEPRQAGERALDKLARELRRQHDKKIFARRREAQKATGKRT